MRKIKIKDKGFPTTDYGYLEPNQEVDVSDGFADYCVERMKAAEYVEAEKPKRRAKKDASR